MNPLAPLSILIVEDDPVSSQLAAHYLKSYGSVIKTSTAAAAVANYMVHRPGIVFVDIHYKHEEATGFDVLRHLLSADQNAYIVMISADHDPKTIQKALTFGAR